MAWFRYLKYGEITSSSVQSDNYQYPNVRRRINFPAPYQDIEQNTWIFIDIFDLNIDKIVNSSLSEESQERSYIVVYESKSNDEYVYKPVNSIISNGKLFFQTAEKHYKDVELTKQYSIYYKTKDIKNIASTTNGSLEDYVLVDEADSEFPVSSVNYQDYYTNINVNDVSRYSISFLNDNVDWKNAVSAQPGAIAVGNFTGPDFKLFCSKGPEYGILKLRIIGLSSDATPTSEVVVDWHEIDLYDSNYSDNNEVYYNDTLNYRKYIFEIRSDFEKNPLSSDGKVKINKFSYLPDYDLLTYSEEISPFLLTRIITIVR